MSEQERLLNLVAFGLVLVIVVAATQTIVGLMGLWRERKARIRRLLTKAAGWAESDFRREFERRAAPTGHSELVSRFWPDPSEQEKMITRIVEELEKP